ncbi:MAG TPA: cytochrome c oxidase assembly protein [Gaiellaceae bacterium]|nr:cytochrome c oxidase assembly protein [Gaiellaceae bacterium]
MIALPARAVIRLCRRGRSDLAPTNRLGLALLAAATTLAALLALDEYADSLLAAHMLQHMLIGDLVPLLLVLAVRGPVHAHLMPAPVVRAARRLRLHRLFGFVTRPGPAFVVWAGSLAVWHVPAVYDDALADEHLHALEHACFLVGGLLVWSVLLDPARRRLLPGWRRVGYAVALLAASGVLANVLVLSYRPLYPAYDEAAARPLALTPLHDQDLAALVMMLEQLVTLGTFAAFAARSELRRPAPAPPVGRHPLAI